MVKLIGGENNVGKMKDDQLRILFDLYDRYFFNGELQKLLGETELNLRFGKATSSAGTCSREGIGGGKCRFDLMISRPIFTSLFTGNQKVEYSGGLECHSQLECLQLTFEHELIHLLFYLRQIDETHGPLFKADVLKRFGHTGVKHGFGQEFLANPVDNAERAKRTLRVGDIVTTTSKTGPIKYKVVSVNTRKNAVNFKAMSLSDGKIWNVPYALVLFEEPKEKMI